VTFVVLLSYASSIAATGLAWAVAWRRPGHRPVALLLTAGLAFDVARRALYLHAVAPGHEAAGAGPLEGWYRVAGHVHAALFIAWPAALAGAALRIFTARPAWPAACAWGVVSTALAAAYPITRGAVLARVFLAAELSALLVAIGAIAAWMPRRRAPAPEHVALALVLVAEVAAIVVGPWKLNVFGTWPLAQVAYATIFGVLVVLQGGVLWARMSSSSSL